MTAPPSLRSAEQREQLVDRLARELWGDRVGPHLREFAARWLACEETDASDDDHVLRWRAAMCHPAAPPER